jgi:hypothetical protein
MNSQTSWYRVRVLCHSGSSALSVDPQPDEGVSGVRLGWVPAHVPVSLVPADLRVPNSIFWVASNIDRELVAVSRDRPFGA